jgi:hypothetical protein
MLLVDAANVVGSRPTGWWRDRAGAARSLYDEIAAALESGQLQPPVVVVLEGAARAGVLADEGDDLRIVHAAHSGDDAIVSLVEQVGDARATVTVVTADRGLRERVRNVGANVVGPRWLLDRLGQAGDSSGRSSRDDGG